MRISRFAVSILATLVVVMMLAGPAQAGIVQDVIQIKLDIEHLRGEVDALAALPQVQGDPALAADVAAMQTKLLELKNRGEALLAKLI